jgi:two-component system chemotaxis sensor kinase CheA
MVDEIIEIDAASVVTPPAPSHAASKSASLKLVERRGRAMPLISLAGLFAITGLPVAAQKALVVRQTDNAVAFAVDRMLGQQEIVVRPIEDPLVKVTGVAGSTDLGDGKPTLVLDLVGLIGLASLDKPRVAS